MKTITHFRDIAIAKVIEANPNARVMSVATVNAPCADTLVKWFDGNRGEWLISCVSMFGKVENLNKGSRLYIHKIWETKSSAQYYN